MSRVYQHKENIYEEKWDVYGINNHGKTCKEGFLWDETKMLHPQTKRFERKVREALEIQFQEASPLDEYGLNLDGGQYVTTRFWKPMFSYLRKKSLNLCDVTFRSSQLNVFFLLI